MAAAMYERETLEREMLGEEDVVLTQAWLKYLFFRRVYERAFHDTNNKSR